MTKYILIDKNYIIPTITNYNDLNTSIKSLFGLGFQRSIIYCSNIYVVKSDDNEVTGIITTDGIEIFETLFNVKTKLNYNNLLINSTINFFVNDFTNNCDKNGQCIDNIKLEHKNVQCADNIKLENKNIDYIKKNNDIHLVIKEHTNEINIADKPEKLVVIDKVVDNSKKAQILKACEEVTELYNNELYNIKRLEINIRASNAKLEKLNKKKNENFFSNLVKIKDEYQTWKKIKYVLSNNITDKEEINKNIILDCALLNERENAVPPVAFISKYNYIDKLQLQNRAKEYLEDINKMDLENIFVSGNLDIDKNTIKFIEAYCKMSKELHYKFTHDWDDLETESTFIPKATNRDLKMMEFKSLV